MKLKDISMKTEIPNPIRKAMNIGLGALAAGYVGFSSTYFVQPNEEAVVEQFGRYISTEGSGVKFKAPWPIQSVEKVGVTDVRRLELGFRTLDQQSGQFEDVLNEALMLTGDENIVDLETIVQYRVSNSRDYLYNCDNVEGTLHDASEAAIRQVVGDHGIDMVLTTGKGEIQDNIRTTLQDVMSKYNCGISITAVQLQDVDPPSQVAEAFQDVASAREDRDRFINEATGYANQIIPQARGEADEMIAQAEGYYAQRTKRAEGDTYRFDLLRAEYEDAPEITGTKMYLEAMGEILPNVDLVVIDDGTGILPLMDMNTRGQTLEEVIKK